MKLDFQSKQKIVEKINKVIKSSISIVVADFCKICAKNMNELRKISRINKIEIFVVRNTLASLAFDKTKYKFFERIFFGQTIIAFSKKEPSLGARLFIEFSKKNSGFKIKGAGFDGKFYSSDKINVLASIPTYNEGVSKLMLIFLESSINRLIRIIFAILNKKKLKK